MVPNNLVYYKLPLPRNFGNEIRFFETGITDFEVLQSLITQKEKSTEQKRGKALVIALQFFNYKQFGSGAIRR